MDSTFGPMRLSRAFATLLMCAASALGCRSSTEPRIYDVDYAHGLWLANRVASYSFDVRVAAFMPSRGSIHVIVKDGAVLSATDSSRKELQGYSFTIDALWVQILNYRSRGELNGAAFDWRGVPVESDMGPWAVDGGVHYSIRNFQPGT